MWEAGGGTHTKWWSHRWDGEGDISGTLMGQDGWPPPREEEGESCATVPSQHPASPSPSSSPSHAHTPTRPRAVTLVFHSQGAPGSSKAGGLVSKAKAWPAASPGREQPGETFPKGSACSWLKLQLCPHVHQPPGHSAADTKSRLEGKLRGEGPTGGEEAGGDHETPTWCLSYPGQSEHPLPSVAFPVCNRG